MMWAYRMVATWIFGECTVRPIVQCNECYTKIVYIIVFGPAFAANTPFQFSTHQMQLSLCKAWTSALINSHRPIWNPRTWNINSIHILINECSDCSSFCIHPPSFPPPPAFGVPQGNDGTIAVHFLQSERHDFDFPFHGFSYDRIPFLLTCTVTDAPLFALWPLLVFVDDVYDDVDSQTFPPPLPPLSEWVSSIFRLLITFTY